MASGFAGYMLCMSFFRPGSPWQSGVSPKVVVLVGTMVVVVPGHSSPEAYIMGCHRCLETSPIVYT